MDDTIYRQVAIETVSDMRCEVNCFDRNERQTYETLNRVIKALTVLPSAEPDGWFERNKDEILKAGMEGREVEFRIGGRLFAIREKAQ